MKIRSTALATTAMFVALTTVATANDNAAFLIQEGTENQALIDQTGASNSALGSGGMVATQIGDANDLLVTQIGGNNVIGQEDEGVVQLGNNNQLDLAQRGFDNAIGAVVQRGDGNRFWTWNNLDVNNNYIARIEQDSSGAPGLTNHMGFGIHGNNNGQGTFSGDAAAVGIAEASMIQIGGGNGADLQVSGDNNTVAGSQIGNFSTLYYWVNGNDNQTALSYEGEQGNNILGLTLEGDRNTVGMRMRTTGNTGNYSAFYMSGGNANDNTMFSDQIGDENSIIADVRGSFNDVDTVQVGNQNETVNTIYSDANTLNIMQDGVNNEFRSVIDGVTGANALFASQTGGDNTSFVDMNGDGNNTFGAPLANGATMYDTALFSGMAGDAASIAGLNAGALVQNGFGNTMDVDVGTSGMSANNNLFAAVQMGDGNEITMNISGDNNQAAISQVGSYNMANLTQFGNGNVAGILQ
jgi:hypothetical protein